MALPDDYIIDARSAAATEAGLRQSSLRRSLSTAYYALFLELVDAGAKALAPASPAGLNTLVGRKLTHEQMKKACIQWSEGNNAWAAATKLGAAPSDLKEVATAFVNLQRLRHEADYDLGARLSGADVHAGIALAEQAITTWRRFRLAAPATANVFLVSLMHPSPAEPRPEDEIIRLPPRTPRAAAPRVKPAPMPAALPPDAPPSPIDLSGHTPIVSVGMLALSPDLLFFPLATSI